MMNKDSGRTTQLVFGAVGGKTVNSYTVDPPNTAALGTGEKPAVLENGGKGSHIFNQEKTWKSAAVLGGTGQRRGSIGGTTVITIEICKIIFLGIRLFPWRQELKPINIRNIHNFNYKKFKSSCLVTSKGLRWRFYTKNIYFIVMTQPRPVTMTPHFTISKFPSSDHWQTKAWRSSNVWLKHDRPSQ